MIRVLLEVCVGVDDATHGVDHQASRSVDERVRSVILNEPEPVLVIQVIIAGLH
jgi:hypothetical protein